MFIYVGARCPKCNKFVPVQKGRDLNIRPYGGTPDVWPYPVICPAPCGNLFEIRSRGDLKEVLSEVEIDIPSR